MERKVGDKFLYKNIEYIVCLSNKACEGCCFLDSKEYCNNSRNTRGMCCACLRRDSKKVIFKVSK